MVEQLTQSEGSQVVIEVWSDLGCPWCYVGKHRLQAAIAQRPYIDIDDEATTVEASNEQRWLSLPTR